MMFDMLVGQPPFALAGSGEIIAAHLYSPAPPLAELAPGLPAALNELVQSTLDKSPSARPQTLFEVVAALDALAPGRGRSPVVAGELPMSRRVPTLALATTLSAAAAEAPAPGRRSSPGHKRSVAAPPPATGDKAPAAAPRQPAPTKLDDEVL